jgi:hypothetical protein
LDDGYARSSQNAGFSAKPGWDRSPSTDIIRKVDANGTDENAVAPLAATNVSPKNTGG